MRSAWVPDHLAYPTTHYMTSIKITQILDVLNMITLYTGSNSRTWRQQLVEQTMRILVVDKRVRIRSALRLLIEHATNHSVVDEIADAHKLMSAIDETTPDLVLLEWELLHEMKSGVIVALKAENPQLKGVVLSGQPSCRETAISAGADHFMSKVDPPDRLLHILKGYA
jgi:DNA-binding NtrC family response regulator